MKRRILCSLIISAMVFSQASCGNSIERQDKQIEEQETVNQQEEITELDDGKSEEKFMQQYDLILQTINELNIYSDYVGAIHSLIWNNVGASKVGESIKNVRQFYDSNDLERYLIYSAFGANNNYEEMQASKQAQQYVQSLEKIEILTKEIDDMYSDLNKTYGKNHNIDDLKEYYIESTTYADYASNVDGSYITYNQTLNEYQTNLAKLKKAAEIAY